MRVYVLAALLLVPALAVVQPAEAIGLCRTKYVEERTPNGGGWEKSTVCTIAVAEGNWLVCVFYAREEADRLNDGEEPSIKETCDGGVRKDFGPLASPPALLP